MRRLARRLAAAFARRGRAARPGAERGRPPPPVRGSARPLWRCAAAAMPGRNKATSNYGCPELTMGQQAGVSGRDAGGRSPHGEEEDRGELDGNLGDPDIVKSPSDPKQYR